MNSVHDVSVNEVFEVLLTNFSSQPQQLPKGMVIAYGSRSPLALIHLTGEAAREVLDGHGLRYAVEDMQERDVADNLAEEGDPEGMRIIKLVDEQLEYQRRPFRHENQILAITGNDRDDEQGTNPGPDETRPREALITVPRPRPEEALITAPRPREEEEKEPQDQEDDEKKPLTEVEDPRTVDDMPRPAGTQYGDSGEKEDVKEDWRERVDLSHLKDASLQLQGRVLEVI